MRVGSLCTGIAGLDRAVESAFNASLSYVADPDPYVSRFLGERYPYPPNLGDIRTATPHRVDILTAGFPCQDISLAGKGAGLDGERSGLWFAVLDWIEQSLPHFVVIENVPALKNRGLDVVLQGLSTAGYGGLWCFYRSGYYSKNPSGFAHIGGCHQRKRLFILARYGTPTFDQHIPTMANLMGSTVKDLLATPTAWLGRRPSHSDLSNPIAHGSGSGRELVRDVASLLPTPTSRDHKGRNQRNDDPCLPGAVDRLLPTPAASRSGSNRGGAAGRVGPVRHSLDSVDKLLPTWGKYAAAIERWAGEIGTTPPSPSVEGRLNPELPEWMLGYPKGWVTDLDLSRTQQLKMLGNAVQPQTAEAAIKSMMEAM